MSNHLAIATVTASLQAMLQSAVQGDVAGATATVARPDSADGLTTLGVNIYLYQVSPNTAWRNVDLPTRGGAGELQQKPMVALDLHYLLTFYGGDATFEPQRVLGSVARTLHAQPLLSKSLIESVVASIAELNNSDLAEEVESVKLMPLSLSLEELSKLWSVFFQTQYSLSMAYLATTVLIESTATPGRPLPVRVRDIQVMPFRSANIEEAVALDGGDVIVFGDTLVLRGSGLGGEITSVHIGDVEVLPLRISDEEVQVTLDDPSLRSGVQGVRIRYLDDSESNTVAVLLRPAIAQDGGGDDIDIIAGSPAMLSVGLLPDIGSEQRVQLYLNAVGASQSYVFSAQARTDPADSASFEIPNVAAGDYLLRVLVDGAETLLRADEDSSSPTFNQYVAPQVTIS